MKIRTGAYIVLFGLAGMVAACGSSQAELDARATASSSPIPTLTPSSTPKPSPTPKPSSTPTQTPTPEPDPFAQIQWEDLNLSTDFRAIPPSKIGIENGASAVKVGSGSEILDTYIAGSFVFVDQARSEYIYGYSVDLNSSQDQELFDQLIATFPDFASHSGDDVESVTLPTLPPSVITSAAVTHTMEGGTILLERAIFRLGSVGGFVFVRVPKNLSPSVQLGLLAQTYSTSIENAYHPCTFTSLEPVEGAPLPAYSFVADGFYPWESRYISLGYQSALNALTGLSENSDTADAAGRITGGISSLGPIMGSEDSPQTVTLTIRGWASSCEVTQTLTWESP